MTRASTARPVRRKRRKIVSLDKKKARTGWLFILPFVIGFAIIYLPIIFESLSYSFCEINYLRGGGGYRLDFVGFENYRKAIFDDLEFVPNLLGGLKQMVFDIPAIVIFSLFMAVLLNKKMLGRAAFRAIFFIPVILSTGLVAGIDAANVLNDYQNNGAINTGAGDNPVAEIVSLTDLTWLFSNMQVGTELMTYVVSIVNNIYNIINRSGVQMLIFLAGLQSVSPAIYESCSIDGATGWETFWKITFPMVSPMILVNTIYTVIDSFTAQSNSIMAYIDSVYTKGSDNMVMATSMYWIYFLIVILLIGLVSAVLSAYIFYQKRD
ncbi:MAG: sugar ABC transporter permease [Clostridia bacterium]|nr:sugar ABC transporter permease [Clostridia bacterium]